MILSDLTVKQPVFATMMMVALVVLGIFSYRELPIDLFPDVDMPVVTVQTQYPGVAPETVETEVTKRIEEAINPIEGVSHITSTSTEGMSVVVTEFELGTDIHTAEQEVRSRADPVHEDDRHPGGLGSADLVLVPVAEIPEGQERECDLDDPYRSERDAGYRGEVCLRGGHGRPFVRRHPLSRGCLDGRGRRHLDCG